MAMTSTAADSGDLQIDYLTIEGLLPGSVEVVERKGVGHPDSLADGLAEALSRAYSARTLSECGAILHHNFDKVGLLGGQAEVRFGGGRLVRRIRVLLNGRASTHFAGRDLGVETLIRDTATRFLCAELPISPEDLEVIYQVSSASSPGGVKGGGSAASRRDLWFHPRSLDDLPELNSLVANDTSLGIGYAPLSLCEQTVLALSAFLSSGTTRAERPWLGSDIKIMAVRVNAMLDLTACIPQMAHHVHSVEEYVANLRSIKEDLLRIAIDSWGTTAVNISLNTRDDLARPEVYLTLTGSSIESGDEGLVGRGNRANGLIASFRPYSVEAGCGKNPVYHVGKVYTVLANDLASEIFSLYGIPCVVALVSQSGSSLTRPWKTMIGIPPGYSLGPTVADLVRERLDGVRAATRRIVAGDVRLF